MNSQAHRRRILHRRNVIVNAARNDLIKFAAKADATLSSGLPRLSLSMAD